MANTPNVLHVNIRGDEEPVRRAFDGLLDRLNRSEEQNDALRNVCEFAADALRNVCEFAAAALEQLEFRDDESRDEALTRRLSAQGGSPSSLTGDDMDEVEAIAEKIRTVVLKDGEYALVEMPGLTAETIDRLSPLLPDELRGRILFVDGRVHTLKPDVE